MERRIIPLKELPLKNDFMFGQVMRNPEICKLFLEGNYSGRPERTRRGLPEKAAERASKTET